MIDSVKGQRPDYLFETSWEVCNKVGGIYTVLSTKAKTLQELFNDRMIFIGPNIPGEENNADFVESKTLYREWKQSALADELKIRVGRWNIPGKPVTVLVDYQSYYPLKNDIYYRMWRRFGVDSLQAYGDYDESCMFAYAVGLVIENFCQFHRLEGKKIVAHFNEWMLGMGALYIKETMPEIATVFTTHATSIGRSIAGNDKPLYKYFPQYQGDRMAKELNMDAKHSLEKHTALEVDCFTTVSELTAAECEQLLEKRPDVITPNGFESNFVPKEKVYDRKRKAARASLINVAERLTGDSIPDDAFLISISGRYEYKNKGIDLFIEAMNRIRCSAASGKSILAFILVPAWNKGARKDLQDRLDQEENASTPLPHPYLTHDLYEFKSDKICGYLKYLNFINLSADRVKIVFVPSYLNGNDGIFDLPYYELLTGMDLTLYPSYYEPWGYTPLESIAFAIPTVTTNLAGFGRWAMHEKTNGLTDGVEVLSRTDDNYFEVADIIKEMVLEYSKASAGNQKKARHAAVALAEKASWSHFVAHYLQAYEVALKKAGERIKN